MENSTSEFQYFVAANAPFLVVSFVGRIDKDCLDKLEKAEAEMNSQENLKYIILYFREVPNVSLEAISALTGMQRRIREKYQLRICSLRPDLKQRLIRMGVVRGLELTDNLQSTILDLKNHDS
jgi:anti-anti-sigma regulatory factor